MSASPYPLIGITFKIAAPQCPQLRGVVDDIENDDESPELAAWLEHAYPLYVNAVAEFAAGWVNGALMQQLTPAQILRVKTEVAFAIGDGSL